MYPDRDITNIVESSHYVQVPNFCRVGHNKCKFSSWVKPYRCLEGQFQSDALLVPEGCMFDHIHNQSRCWQFDRWNTTADEACKARKPSLHLMSFAMLLPCGIDVFSGVEFVCCPKTYKGRAQARSQQLEEPLALPSLDHRAPPAPPADASPTSSSSPSSAHSMPTTAPQEVGTRDSYFSRFDPHEEHDAFRKAEQRLEERHRDKVSKILKEWSELEVRYQELKKSDPHGADQFKERMTHRFQSTVDAVEAENEAEKHQLSALHQQRVVAHINEMKREAMTCYTRALRETQPNTHKVQKCLQKLLRALNKDRHHTVSHYKHLLNTDFRAAERERDSTLQHLSDLDRMTNQSLQMLQRHRELYEKMGRLMHDYANSLRKKDTTPAELSPDSSFLLSQEEENASSETRTDDYEEDDADDDAEYDDAEEDHSQEPDESDEVKAGSEEPVETPAPSSTDTPAPASSTAVPAPSAVSGATKLEEPEDVAVSFGQPPHVEVSSSSSSSDEQQTTKDNSTADEAVAVTHHQEAPLAAHAQHHELVHEQTGYSVRTASGSPAVSGSESRGVYFTLAFAGVALMAAMVVGIVVLRRRAVRHPSQQGFMEVDQNATVITPEERHVANMQVNGYENPTYKFFEEK
ncbi:amyloid-beta-like protein isoform X2 [Hyalella azteca]|nr:amyloid-beta-like protein isoform X2 [Hyalella azteca]